MQLLPKKGILLVNLGTPDAPTPSSVSRYLKTFLSDSRVVDLPKILWQPLLRGIILPIRSPKVAKLYQSIWLEGGSPLYVYTKAQAEALSKKLPDHEIAFAFCYSEPTVNMAMDKLLSAGVEDILILPLYPQYSCSTSAAVFDAVARSLQKRRAIPSLRFIRDYATFEPYIDALVTCIKNHTSEHGIPDKLLFSLHGIPVRFANQGDDYPLRCQATTAAVNAKLVNELVWKEDIVQLTYQSKFGKEPWLVPATDATVESLAKSGIKHLQIICPGFSSDCLETLEEISIGIKESFIEHGGEKFSYIPALNASDNHIEMLEKLIYQHF
ncbi:ferrochelatase [Thorsellia anophelis]|uniref:Ferrochelatase n=1 Tax=Thorsellia anophelis DSM 18579 TaxID=1123402 RepID=A0A1H9Y7K4_9GAMM|nr:ferrochelatase [Thorsellia anophelis]SES64389.1 ferrochelatase [Thorsellia anophelis DSM 18579]